MRSAAAALIVFAGEALAHEGHNAPNGHFHSFGFEHALLLAAVVGFVAYAIRK